MVSTSSAITVIGTFLSGFIDSFLAIFTNANLVSAVALIIVILLVLRFVFNRFKREE